MAVDRVPAKFQCPETHSSSTALIRGISIDAAKDSHGLFSADRILSSVVCKVLASPFWHKRAASFANPALHRGNFDRVSGLGVKVGFQQLY